MSSPGLTVLVIAKEPRPGRVKTRLTPDVTPRDAARLAEAALRDTLAVVSASPATRRVLVLAGRPGPWLPEGFEVVPQRGAGLDERLSHAFSCAIGPTLLVGMDTPQLLARHLELDFDAHDAWLGPATDGGFWMAGFRRSDPSVFPGVPMSTAGTGAALLERMRAAGHDVGIADELCDVDTMADAEAVAALAPGTQFAATYRSVLAPRRRRNAYTSVATAVATATIASTTNRFRS